MKQMFVQTVFRTVIGLALQSLPAATAVGATVASPAFMPAISPLQPLNSGFGSPTMAPLAPLQPLNSGFGGSTIAPLNSGFGSPTAAPLPGANSGLGGPVTGPGSGLTTTPLATQPPATVTLVSPANGATVAAPGTVALMASVTPGVNVSELQFFDGNNMVGNVSSAPFIFNLNNLGTGLHTLTAQAVTQAGIISSVPVSVAVTGPQAALDIVGHVPTPQLSVELIAPLNGDVFLAGTNIALVASESDVNGSPLSVQFFANMTFVGSGIPVVGGVPPQALFAFDWAAVPAGQYAITAVLTDSGGTMTASAPVVISVRGTTGGR